MRYEINPTLTLGINVTNDGAMEKSYVIVRATSKRETVLAELSNSISAERAMQSMRHEMRADLTYHPNKRKCDLILKEVHKVGKQLKRDKNNTIIRWEQVHETTIKTVPIRRYHSKSYANRVMGI